MTNTETQKNKKGNAKMVIALLAGITLVYFIVSTVVNERLSDLQLETKILISEQETLLASISEITARNGADSVTEEIIRDCSLTERLRFDQLLSSLDRGLFRAELVELERLFGRCGNFYSQRKSVMVARLQREVEIYETFVQQLENLSGNDELKEYRVPEWKELADLEMKQSELFTELVSVQDEIIASLLAGNSATSEEITSVLGRATEINETLLVTSKQAANIRSSLVSL